MWFTGRFRGDATVLVLDPWQVTALPPPVPEPPVPVLPLRRTAEVFTAGTAAVGFEPAEVGSTSLWRDEPEPGDVETEGEAETAVAAAEEAPAGRPSSRTPEPSPHALRERAARVVIAAVAAALRRRMREFRMLDM
jgi:hypothetical protein